MEISRRQALKGLVGLVGGAGLATGLTGFTQESALEPLKYTFEDFTKALGERYSSIPDSDKQRVRDYWNNPPKDSELTREEVVELYQNPKKFEEIVFTNIEIGKIRAVFWEYHKRKKEKKVSRQEQELLKTIEKDMGKIYPWKIDLQDYLYSEAVLINLHEKRLRKKAKNYLLLLEPNRELSEQVLKNYSEGLKGGRE